MATWDEFQKEVPDLAGRVLELFDAEVHKTIATLRKDGSPRISGIEARVADGQLWIGSMPNAVKARDLQRDGRFALHSGGPGGDAWQGDAKVAGVAHEITDQAVKDRVIGGNAPPGPNHLFFLEITEAVVTSLGGNPPDHLVIESWHEGRGYERIKR
jgi:hypothetical protein